MKKIDLRCAVRQGYSMERAVHYFVFIVENGQGIEVNTRPERIFEFIIKEIMPKVEKPYEFAKYDYSNRKGGFLIQVERPMSYRDVERELELKNNYVK